MSIESVLEGFKSSPSVARNVTTWRHLPARKENYVDFPPHLHPKLAEALRKRGIERLYSHQATALALLGEGKNIVVVTPTASGKTLCYNLPVLQTMLEQPQSKALYLFPTKALSQDQLAELRQFSQLLPRSIKAFTYDGDTPPDLRRAIREEGEVVITNPDMLHTGILPHHTTWIKFFSALKYVVIDEIHYYRGVFGSHLTNLIRRLKRVCQHYGSQPQYICSSATIANPMELASRLVEEEIELVDNNGAPSSEKHFIFFNPPIVDKSLGIRSSYIAAARKLSLSFLEKSIPTIVFATSRLNVEVLVKYLKDVLEKGVKDEGKVRGYRGGYLPRTRREIEKGLREGEVIGVVSTNALELGIDIGSLDACVIAGYPGTISSTWQQAGRSGRRSGGAVAILVARSNPLDQFIINNPDYFFGSSPEYGLINPDNLIVLVNHIKCAAFELPFVEGEKFGSEDLTEILRFLEEDEILFYKNGRWYWTQDSYPANDISLRSITADNFVVIDRSEKSKVIGEVDYTSAPTLLYKDAIYMSESQLYQVEELDFAGRKAYVRQVNSDYYTDAISYTGVRILDIFQSQPSAKVVKAHGEVRVNSRVVGYKKIKFYTMENVGYGEVSLPEQEFHTTAYWFTIPEPALSGLGFERSEVIDGLLGLSYLLQHIAAFFLMCDVKDIDRCLGDKEASWFIRQKEQGRGIYSYEPSPREVDISGVRRFEPTLFLYENYPGGVGFSEHLYRGHQLLLQKAEEAIERCRCRYGCPSCVGPVPVTGSRVKQIAYEILKAIQ